MSMGLRQSARAFGLACALALSLSSPLAAAPLDASTASVQTLAGGWKLTLAGKQPRECLLQFNAAEAKGGLSLGLPAPCKSAMKLLLQVGAWTLGEDGRIGLTNAKGETVLGFARKAAGQFGATGPAGEDFLLEPQSGRYDNAERIRAVELAIANVVNPQESPRMPKAAAGRYEIYRGAGKNTGCILILDTRTGPKSDLGRAALEKSCQDKGLNTFDPVGWHVERGDRLFLQARKGHAMGFNREKFGWDKDPVKGSPLQLMRQ